MALSDVLVPLTAKKIGPSATTLTRAKVHYLKSSSEPYKVNYDSVRNNAIIFQSRPNRKIELLETPDELTAAQALAQGATANINAAFHIASAQTASGSTVGSALAITKYFTEVSAGNGLGVVLPDPFVRRLCVIKNTTTGTITVYGRGATSPIEGSTAGYSLTTGKRKHFVAPTAATAGTTAGWKIATDA